MARCYLPGSKRQTNVSCQPYCATPRWPKLSADASLRNLDLCVTGLVIASVGIRFLKMTQKKMAIKTQLILSFLDYQDQLKEENKGDGPILIQNPGGNDY